ncbi:MAG: zinc ribbon domain-containing protein [Firmicutes bacterium]|nr:zinc ribbon domain-containing protein [Bacillota bacterium]
MGTQRYKCSDCRREFDVRFFWSKPRPEELSCPNCGSKKVAETAASCSCSSRPDNDKGFRFT